jgi:hypothetical protein
MIPRGFKALLLFVLLPQPAAFAPLALTVIQNGLAPGNSYMEQESP